MTHELRLKREAAEKAFEVAKEKDRTVMRLEEKKFLAISTKDLSEDDAYWIEMQKKNKSKTNIICTGLVNCEKEVTEAANDSDEAKSESIMRLSWALVHSRQPEDVQRGIAMLEASIVNTSSPLQKREKIYLLAVGYYRSGDFPRSRMLLDQCLEIAPDWRQALSLKKAIEDSITKDGVVGIGITATAVGLIAGGIAAAL
ncbi:mitochondrial fission 1 protein A-like protein, partial [Tanacetum coccineum]